MGPASEGGVDHKPRQEDFTDYRKHIEETSKTRDYAYNKLKINKKDPKNRVVISKQRRRTKPTIALPLIEEKQSFGN